MHANMVWQLAKFRVTRRSIRMLDRPLAARAVMRGDVVVVLAVGADRVDVDDYALQLRQAVQQRFGRDADAADADAADAVAAEAAAAAGPTRPAPERRTLAPVTAFTEMAALRRLGRFGWHAVWFGALYFDLERTDRQWEHRRQLVWQGRPEGPGWQPFGPGWFPWSYFARPLDEPALVPPPGYDPFET